MKKGIQLLSILVFLLNSAFMQDKTKKIQEELIKTIQTEYINWQIEKSNSPSMSESLSLAGEDTTASKDSKNINNIHASIRHPHHNCHLYDFEFKITSTQAVVQFKADNLIKSAFLEKIDGEWQLICCADITPDL